MIANIERGWPAMGEGRGAVVARRLYHRDSLAAEPRLDDVDASQHTPDCSGEQTELCQIVIAHTSVVCDHDIKALSPVSVGLFSDSKWGDQSAGL
jgi:hypothetical protein